MLMNRLNHRNIYIFFVFFLVCICLGFNENNERTFTAEQLVVADSKLPLFVRNDSKVARIDESNGHVGNFTGGPLINLDKGEYDIVIKYRTDTDNNYIDLFSRIAAIDSQVYQNQDMHLKAATDTKTVHVKLEKGGSFLEVRSFYNGTGFLEIESIKFTKKSIMYHDKFIYVTLIFGLFIMGVFFKVENKFNSWVYRLKRSDKGIYGCLLISVFMVSYPLLNEYIIVGHDLAFHLNRIEGIKEGLLSGQFPVRIHPTHFGGYGYATPIMYPEMLLYIPALFRLIDMSMVTAYQIFCFIINLLTAWIAYFSFWKISKSKYIGLTGAVLYTFAWYRLCNIYVRAAVGEMSAMAFFPLFLLGCYYLIYGDHKKWLYAVVGYTFILQSHILSAVIAAGLAILFGSIYYRNFLDKERMISAFKAISIAFLLNAWFIIPFLSFYKLDLNIKNAFLFIHEFALNPSQLFTLSFLPLQSALDYYDGIAMFRSSLKLGAAIIVGILLFLFKAIHGKKRWSIRIGWMSLGIGMAFAYCSTKLFPWHLIEQVPIIGNMAMMLQFPWRLLGFSTVFLCFAAAIGFVEFIKYCKNKKAIFVGFYVFCYLSSSLLLDQYAIDKPFLYKSEMVSFYGDSIGWGEYLYKGTDIKALESSERKVESSDQNLFIENFVQKGTNISFDYKIASKMEDAFVDLPLLYYPGYVAYDTEGNKLVLQRGNNNVVRIILPKLNQNHIELSYKGKTSFRLATAISWITFLTLLVCLLRNRNRKE